jgi:pyruvate formate lyase activating enzyme
MVAPLSDGGGLPIGDENSGPRKYTIDKHICNDCGACTEVCPAGACTSIGYTVEVGELAARLERDRVFFEKSGGGITLSGGEVTSQPKFAASLLEECRKRGLHTAIETCGYVQWKTLLDLYSNTDLVLYDIKLLDPARHRRYTGVDNGIILENAVRTAQLGIPMVVRVPIIPGYNDAPEDLDELAAFVSQRLHGVDTIHLLPYETLGKAKYERLGKQYLLSHDEPPNTKQMQVAAERIEAQGLNVRIGG